MNYPELQQLIERESTGEPFDTQDFRDAPATDKEIALVEQKIGAVLPPDYVNFLKEFGGGLIGSVDIFSVQPEGKQYLLDNQPLDAQGKFVAFAGNGCGDYYGFRIIDGICVLTVVFYDHELGGEITAIEDETTLNFCGFVASYGFGN